MWPMGRRPLALRLDRRYSNRIASDFAPGFPPNWERRFDKVTNPPVSNVDAAGEIHKTRKI
jgi:hypothetical protein